MIRRYPNTSKECPKKTETQHGEVIVPKPYGTTSELGEINTISRTIEAKGKSAYNSGVSFFEGTASRERFKSIRFRELALKFATDTSNHKAASRLNRIRHEREGIGPTVYRNLVEREGSAIQEQMERRCEEALLSNGFKSNGELLEETRFTSHMEQAAIENAAIRLNIWEYNASEYELPNETVNISIDDVCVKRQTEMRPRSEENQQPKRVNNIVIHVQSNRKSYILNADSILDCLKLLIGLLLLNDLLKKQIVIFADGARDIHNVVLKMLSFANCKIILDWYHLKKKCQEQLSMALKGSKISNEFFTDFLPCLWFGNVDGAINKLQNIEPPKIKN